MKSLLMAESVSVRATQSTHRDLCDQECDDVGYDRVAVSLFADDVTLREFILSTSCQPEHLTFFRAAAPEWNHAFRWCSLESAADDPGTSALQGVINASFHDAGKKADDTDSNTLASLPARWTWLALSGVKLKVVGRGNVEKLPLRNSLSVLGIDAWDCAYFLDFGHQARSQVRALLENLKHWQFTFDALAVASSTGTQNI